MKQFDHMIERKLNLELSNVFPRLSNIFLRLKFLAGCGQFSDFSNKKITHDCGILKLLEPGDELMADRGFDIEADMPNGVSLNIPPFLNGQPQLSAEDEVKTRKIASVRVHVERAIARIKTYGILHQVVRPDIG